MSESKRLKIKVSEEIGSVSAILIQPADARALLVLSHGAGAGMEHTFMEQLAQQLAVHRIGTLRFNFAYMERGGGPDRPPKAHLAIRAAVQEAEKYAEGLPLLAGGKSFGGRMTSLLAATGGLESIQGIVYFGFPLHAAGKPGTERAAHLSDIPQPQLFLQGTRDNLARYDLIESVCSQLERARLVRMEGGDHSFKTLKRSGVTQEEMIDQLARETAAFAQSL
ncbi:alpha/beta hydrolase family protein [Flavilitoribacter nigricans]|uniref:Alpha/beta hydrolase n=1 Tax=Flavilitoribacter nigricans (strain ATCC 23147 / DSM 23189 / NBRC 102662 / NCIMB 1420 / SS-2) TaxID=1122177 RepID=A0A2D0NC63_FLAN2|nr:alpha/beta family hydrolase [Flavilitoribacter nigricans]PHN06075.1 alpha/beta hydrolase [Flavilitoribacter nigricans DSM 23189 = NBRC 102662]